MAVASMIVGRGIVKKGIRINQLFVLTKVQKTKHLEIDDYLAEDFTL